MNCLILHRLMMVAMAFAVSTSSHAMTLKEAVAQAVADNPSVKAAQASRGATDRVRKQAIGRFFPEIDVNADIGREAIDRIEGLGPDNNEIWRTRRKVAVTVTQNLFDGFDRLNEYYASEARISAAAYKILARSDSVALNAIEAYIDVVRHDNLKGLGKQNVERHRKLLKLVKARVEGGKNSEGDLDQTEERLQAALALLSQIRSLRDVAAAKFKNAVGIAPTRLRRPGSPNNPFKSAASATQTAITLNPRLTALKFDIDSAGYRVDQAKSSYFPTIGLEGTYSHGEDLAGTAGKSVEMRGMITLTWKLFDGLQNVNRVGELTEREYVKIAEHDSLMRDLRQEIEISWSRITEGNRQVVAKRKQLRQTEKVVAAYRQEYEADKRSLLDVLDAENSRFVIEFELSNVISVQQFASYQLLGHTGVLLEQLGIDKPSGSNLEANPVRRSVGSNMFKSFVIPPLKLD